ncbi:MAG: hypothetical protein EOL89_14465 [Actinobacteria bacterium]|nr:hypothetical protein [Actinomycetota bacterium]
MTFSYDQGWNGQPLVPQKQKKSCLTGSSKLGCAVRSALLFMVGFLVLAIVMINSGPPEPPPCQKVDGQPVNLETDLPRLLDDRFRSIEEIGEGHFMVNFTPREASIGMATIWAQEDTVAILQCVANSDRNDAVVVIQGFGGYVDDFGNPFDATAMVVGYTPEVYNQINYGHKYMYDTVWELAFVKELNYNAFED